MAGWLGGGTNGRTDGQTDRQTDELTDRQMDARTDFPCILQDIIPFGSVAQKDKQRSVVP